METNRGEVPLQKIYDYELTGHDMDYFRCVSPSTYLKIAESAGFIASQRLGMVMKRMVEELGATWMTASVRLETEEMLYTVGPLEVYTEPFYEAGMLFSENLVMCREGRTVVRCALRTMAVNYRTRKVMPPGDVAAYFGQTCEKLPAAPKRMTMPREMELRETYPVRYSDCDHNRHMRAYQYADLICDTVEYWNGGKPKLCKVLELEYLGECRVGERLELYRAPADKPGAFFVKGVRTSDGKDSFHAYLETE